MIQKASVGKTMVGIVLAIALCLALTVPADAGRGFGGGGGGMGMGGGGGMSMGGGGIRGGFNGTRGGFVAGGFQGGRFNNGKGFHGGNGFKGHAFHGCCANTVFLSGFAFGSFPAPFYSYPYSYYAAPPYPYPYAPQLDVVMPAVPSRAPLDSGSYLPREACYASGCYQLQGDGVTVAYQWVWVPAPPPPPAVIPYPTGRYELRGPSRWEWVPNSSLDLSVAPTVSPVSKTAEPGSGGVTVPVRGLYRWTDDNGVTHWTQGLDAVPERYRPKAKPGAGAGPEGTL